MIKPETDFEGRALYMVVCSDSLQFGLYDKENGFRPSFRENRLLELRVFDSKKEWKCWRDALQEEFSERLLEDNGQPWFEEVHLLDRDTARMKKAAELSEKAVEPGKKAADPNKSGMFVYYAMGGGKYELPFPGAEKVRVRSYLTAAQNGIEYIDDWRVVSIEDQNEQDLLKGVQ